MVYNRYCSDSSKDSQRSSVSIAQLVAIQRFTTLSMARVYVLDESRHFFGKQKGGDVAGLDGPL